MGIEGDLSQCTDELTQSVIDRFSSRLSDIAEAQKTAERDSNSKLESVEKTRSEVQTEKAKHEAGITFCRERIEKIDEESSEIKSILENASQNTNKYNRMKKKEKTIQDDFDKVDWDSEGEKLESDLEKLKSRKFEIEHVIETAENNEETAKRKLDLE